MCVCLLPVYLCANLCVRLPSCLADICVHSLSDISAFPFFFVFFISLFILDRHPRVGFFLPSSCDIHTMRCDIHIRSSAHVTFNDNIYRHICYIANRPTYRFSVVSMERLDTLKTSAWADFSLFCGHQLDASRRDTSLRSLRY